MLRGRAPPFQTLGPCVIEPLAPRTSGAERGRCLESASYSVTVTECGGHFYSAVFSVAPVNCPPPSLFALKESYHTVSSLQGWQSAAKGRHV